jgi:hypothetical protein
MANAKFAKKVYQLQIRIMLELPELLPDVPPRLMNELREWAGLRRSSVEAAAIEMIQIGLHARRDQGAKLPEGLDVMEEGTRH